MKPVFRLARGVVFGAVLGLGCGAANAQSAAKTVWDGVYTDAQADAGKAVFTTNCSKCHGPTAGGGDFGPALTGGTFMGQFGDKTLADVFDFISTEMPLDQPASLSDGDYLKALTFIMRANKFPAGSTDLTSDHAALAAIAVTKQK